MALRVEATFSVFRRPSAYLKIVSMLLRNDYEMHILILSINDD